MALYPEKQIRDVAGLPSIRGRDFVAGAQGAGLHAFGPTYLLGRQAVSSTRLPRAVVTLDDGTVVARRCGRRHRRHRDADAAAARQPAASGPGRALSYFVVDPEAHRGQDVVVVGGGDSALDWADALATIARSVTLVHRRAHVPRARGDPRPRRDRGRTPRS